MYREHAISPALQSVASCTWQHTSAVAARSCVVPDACVDLVWDGARLNVAGPDTGPVTVEMRAGTQIVGLRFVPGAAGSLLGVPASAVRDARVPLRELWGDSARELEERLHAARDAETARLQLQAAVQKRMRSSAALDPVASAVARALRPELREDIELVGRVPRVAQLSAALGVSDRQLLRRCDAAFGYGPKMLARILRFQAFVQALRTSSHLGLAELAIALGYTDQAHLAHETADLAGQTPRELQTRWVIG
jgi:AraC-like DNA-binding protein